MDNKINSTDAFPPFSGTPRKYQRIAWLLAISTHAFLYGGLLLIEYGWHGRDWLLGAKPIAFTLVSTLLFAQLCYRALMVVDAQYRIKLPEEG